MSIGNLYIYDEDSFDNLREQLCEYEFFDIAFFIDLYPNIDNLKQLDNSKYQNIVIDISDLIHESNYNKLYVSTYLRTLLKFNNVIFCISSLLYYNFKIKYPVLHFQLEKNNDFHKSQGETNENSIDLTIAKLCVYTYSNITNANLKNKKIITLSELINDWNSLVINYNIDAIQKVISEQEIEFVDLSSSLIALHIRKDLILQFEILLYKIARATDVKFCTEISLIDDLNYISPFLFKDLIELEETELDEKDGRPENIEISEIETQIDSICQKLIGHEIFKNDFKNAFLKHKFLNQMGERNILSMILCGNSGIGKTEFAKIASKVLYPDEQLIKINFGNYSTEGVLNSLIGSPLGYVGSEEGGELINKIKNSKSKIILIDEFEKATPSVYNFFYELLEDSVFTDRHGKAYDLGGYIIVFTSNMSENQYKKHIPDSLKSRFDMVYYFVDIPQEEKIKFINDESTKLIDRLNKEFNIKIELYKIQKKLHELVCLQNLRDIKRKIEDIIFLEFFELYRHSQNDEE